MEKMFHSEETCCARAKIFSNIFVVLAAVAVVVGIFGGVWAESAFIFFSFEIAAVFLFFSSSVVYCIAQIAENTMPKKED